MKKSASLICDAGLILLMAQAPAGAQGALYGEAGPNFEKAKPDEVRVYITKAMEQPLDAAVMAQADKAIGKHVVISWGSARGNIREAILAGKGEFELAIVLPDVNEQLLAAGKIKPNTYEIAVTPIAFGVRGDASAVDISTPDAVKKTLLAATSVKYAPTGAALLTVKKVLGDLQIADKIKDNSKVMEDVALTGNQYEIVIYPLSEAIPRKANKTVTLGPVIKEFQVPSVMQASIGANTRDEAGAKALVNFLQGPATDSAFKAGGFEKGRKMAAASPGQPAPPDLNAIYSVQDWPIKTLREGKVYVVPGGGSNSTVIIGDKGVIVVDVKTTMATGEQLLKKIATLTSKPVTHVIETHSDCDHINGIVAFPKAVKIIAHANNRTEQIQVARLATVEVNGGYGVAPQDRLPNVVVTKNKEMATINGVRFAFYHFAPAHTAGDMMVYLPDEKILVTGDIFAFTTKTNNGLLFKYEKDGSPAGWFQNAEGALKTGAEVFVTGHTDQLLTKPDLQKVVANFRAQMSKVDALAASGKSLEETTKEMGDPPFDPMANTLRPNTMKECPRGTVSMSPSWIRWQEWTNEHQSLKAMSSEK